MTDTGGAALSTAAGIIWLLLVMGSDTEAVAVLATTLAFSSFFSVMAR